MQETSLHAQIKNRYREKGADVEVNINGFKIDVVIENLLIEVQTRNFSKLKPKLSNLLDDYKVRLVHPIPQEKWIIRLENSYMYPTSRRKSPKHGRYIDLFYELVHLAQLPRHPNFSLEVLLTYEEEYRKTDGRGSWRRKGDSIIERRLIDISSTKVFACPDDYLIFLRQFQNHLGFTTKKIAQTLGIPLSLSQKMVYCLHVMGLIKKVGKQERAILYQIN